LSVILRKTSVSVKSLAGFEFFKHGVRVRPLGALVSLRHRLGVRGTGIKVLPSLRPNNLRLTRRFSFGLDVSSLVVLGFRGITVFKVLESAFPCDDLDGGLVEQTAPDLTDAPVDWGSIRHAETVDAFLFQFFVRLSRVASYSQLIEAPIS